MSDFDTINKLLGNLRNCCIYSICYCEFIIDSKFYTVLLFEYLLLCFFSCSFSLANLIEEDESSDFPLDFLPVTGSVHFHGLATVRATFPWIVSYYHSVIVSSVMQ